MYSPMEVGWFVRSKVLHEGHVRANGGTSEANEEAVHLDSGGPSNVTVVWPVNAILTSSSWQRCSVDTCSSCVNATRSCSRQGFRRRGSSGG
jgi:hypothetical protein